MGRFTFGFRSISRPILHPPRRTVTAVGKTRFLGASAALLGLGGLGRPPAGGG